MHASRNQAEAHAQLTHNDLPRYIAFKLVKPSLKRTNHQQQQPKSF